MLKECDLGLLVQTESAGVVICSKVKVGERGRGRRYIGVWDWEKAEELRTLEGHTGCVMALLQVGDVLVRCSDDYTLKVWNVDTWALERTMEGHTGYVYCLAQVAGNVMSGAADDTSKL